MATAALPSASALPPLPSSSMRSVLADLALRLAQLDWPIACDLDRDEKGRELIVMRRIHPSTPYASIDAGTFRVGVEFLGRPRLVEAILDELRARGWDRAPAAGLPRDDVRWCAPA